MMKWNKDGGGAVVHIDELGHSTVTSHVLQALKDEGKLGDVADVRAPGTKTVPAPQEDETIVSVAFFGTDFCFPCVGLVAQVLQLYGVDLAQIVKLGVFEWVLRSTGVSDRDARLFAYLHDGRCQHKKKKDTGETLNFGSVHFQPKTRHLKYTPAPTARNRWETGWTRRWFYHKCPVDTDLRSVGGPIQLVPSPKIDLSSREEALLRLLLNATWRLSTRDLLEEFCVLRVWPLAQG